MHSELTPIRTVESSDGSVMFQWDSAESGFTESLYINYDDRENNTICVSSQIGCEVGCEFCHVPTANGSRNLTASEISSQVIQITEYISNQNDKILPDELHIAYMGAGEPMHNLGNVVTSKQHIETTLPSVVSEFAISTSGWVPGIRALAELDPDFDLHVSLHAPDDETRHTLIPEDMTYPIEQILLAAREYANQSANEVALNYVLIEGVNDSDNHLEKLISLLEDEAFTVILSNLNTPRNPNLSEAPEKRFRKFESKLNDADISVYRQESKAQDIDSGCGQLQGYEDETMKRVIQND